MTADELTKVLHRDIPIARAMGVAALEADPGCVLLTAPLTPNINHMGTLFGGSANTLATHSSREILLLFENYRNRSSSNRCTTDRHLWSVHK